MNCLSCNNPVPEARVKLGFTVCVNCSTVEHYSCHVVYDGKTGHFVQPIADKQTARALKALGRRASHGPSMGMMPAPIPKEKDGTGQEVDSANIKTFKVTNAWINK